MASFNLQKIARPNILALEPYRCARDDYKVGVLLDANELTHGPSLSELDDQERALELNRYPDPHQIDVKQLACDLRNSESTDSSLKPLTPANMFLGVGSDEAIDAIIRALCVPGKDKILTCPPTYGMYAVSAQINDVDIVKVNMTFEKGNFQPKPEEISKVLAEDPSIKIVYICSPGNPTGTLVDRPIVETLLNHPTWNGIVVVDEAYIDFAPIGTSMAPQVTKYPNLAVMQTLSKSFGLAGARLGMTFASPELAQILNNMKAPYNISSLTADIAARALSKESIAKMRSLVGKVVEQRDRLVRELPQIPGMGQIIGGQDANFLLIEVLDKPNGKPSSETAKKVYTNLAEKKNVVVRYRGNEPGCEGALRISIGTKEETDVLLKELTETLGQIQQ
ncbi:hypothetical protein TRVA0_034S00738 [Trichomonascus vanleenenianus]|uniref:histidinol-phosphate transaminase n=1 Tax=Trichomonascus vanleenenianus TaxID=2268995 RepID=UPI003ECB99C2